MLPPSPAPFPPLAAGQSIVNVNATVIHMSVTIAGDLNVLARTPLQTLFGQAFGCFEPACMLQTHVTLASIHAVITMTIPDRPLGSAGSIALNGTRLATRVATTASNLAANLDQLTQQIGIQVLHSSTPNVRAGLSVSLVVNPEASSSVSPQSPSPSQSPSSSMSSLPPASSPPPNARSPLAAVSASLPPSPAQIINAANDVGAANVTTLDSTQTSALTEVTDLTDNSSQVTIMMAIAVALLLLVVVVLGCRFRALKTKSRATQKAYERESSTNAASYESAMGPDELPQFASGNDEHVPVSTDDYEDTESSEDIKKPKRKPEDSRWSAARWVLQEEADIEEDVTCPTPQPAGSSSPASSSPASSSSSIAAEPSPALPPALQPSPSTTGSRVFPPPPPLRLSSSLVDASPRTRKITTQLAETSAGDAQTQGKRTSVARALAALPAAAPPAGEKLKSVGSPASLETDEPVDHKDNSLFPPPQSRTANSKALNRARAKNPDEGKMRI
jgi:hypothetical protein